MSRSPSRHDSEVDEHATPARSGTRGPIRRDEYIRRVREALVADYVALQTSPLCSLPGVVALARSDYAHKIFPEAAALRALLDRASAVALKEVEGLEEKRMQQLAAYLRLARQHVPVAEITRQLGLHSRSYVHTAIQRQALELVTEAFLRAARGGDNHTGAGRASDLPPQDV